MIYSTKYVQYLHVHSACCRKIQKWMQGCLSVHQNRADNSWRAKKQRSLSCPQWCRPDRASSDLQVNLLQVVLHLFADIVDGSLWPRWFCIKFSGWKHVQLSFLLLSAEGRQGQRLSTQPPIYDAPLTSQITLHEANHLFVGLNRDYNMWFF